MNTPTNYNLFSASSRPDEQWLARALPEESIDPALPIIDPHVHFWHHKSGYHYFVEDFARDLAASGHNVVATVFEECNAYYRARGPQHLKWVGETEFAVGQAAIAASGKYTSCRAADAIIGFADLTLDEKLVRETLEAHVAAGNGRFRGVRMRAKWDPDPAVRGPVSAEGPGLYLTPEFHRGLGVLASMNLAFDASIFHPQLPDVAAAARAHPEASIVVVHCGSPVGHSSYAGKEKEVHAEWVAGMKELARCPNVTIKMGGLLLCLGSFDYTKAERPPTSEELAALWRPWIEPCVEIFGADRCMVSSNFPVDKSGAPYGTIWNMFKRVAAGCSPREKEMLFSGTAKRVYRMD